MVNLGDDLNLKGMSGFEFIIPERETSIGGFRVGRLQQAKEDWIHRRFPGIIGETEFVPYPEIG